MIDTILPGYSPSMHPGTEAASSLWTPSAALSQMWDAVQPPPQTASGSCPSHLKID